MKLYNLIKSVFPDTTLNDTSIIKNPETNYPLELDIYVPTAKLAIEVDGKTHREPIYGIEELSIQRKRDNIKDQECKKLCIELHRVAV